MKTLLRCLLLASLFPSANAGPTLLAHRGLAQDYSRDGLTNTTCTAAQMLPPTHGFLENTIASMRAAFDYGADVVEFDIHPTTDGEFAVFHDWTVECRTEGKGVTRELPMTTLTTLDVGYGYTADGGRTFPFRGLFKGQMPTWAEVMAAFPERDFMVNVKGNRAAEADLIIAYMDKHAMDRKRLRFFGGDNPIARLRVLDPGLRAQSKDQLKSCLVTQIFTGWLGHMPEGCRNAVVFVPINYTWLVWGWPTRFVERMKGYNTEVYVFGPMGKAYGSTGIDTAQMLAEVMPEFTGGINTNHIEVIGPLVKKKP